MSMWVVEINHTFYDILLHIYNEAYSTLTLLFYQLLARKNKRCLMWFIDNFVVTCRKTLFGSAWHCILQLYNNVVQYA